MQEKPRTVMQPAKVLCERCRVTIQPLHHTRNKQVVKPPPPPGPAPLPECKPIAEQLATPAPLPPDKALSLTSTGWTAVQAMAACLGIAGLTWYCLETMVLRRTAQAQAAAQVRPVVVIIKRAGKIEALNVGPGPAINLGYEYEDQAKNLVFKYRSALAVNEHVSLGWTIDHARGFGVSYESLDGDEFESVASFVKDGDRLRLRLYIRRTGRVQGDPFADKPSGPHADFLETVFSSIRNRRKKEVSGLSDMEASEDE